MRRPSCFALLLGLLLTTPAFAQEQPSDAARFDPMVELKPTHSVDTQATVRAKSGRMKPVALSMRNWIIPNRQRIERFPEQGLLVIQIRAGSVTTIIGGKRQERGTDEFWIVPAGTTMGIETGQDSAILQVVALRNAK
jgi:hypothetical protein